MNTPEKTAAAALLLELTTRVKDAPEKAKQAADTYKVLVEASALRAQTEAQYPDK